MAAGARSRGAEAPECLAFPTVYDNLRLGESPVSAYLSANGTHPILYLSREEVAHLLPGLDEQIELVAATFAAHREGRIQLPPKPGVHPRPDSVVRALPVYLEEQDVAAVKWVGGFAGNRARGINFMNGLIILSSGDTGLPLAVVDAAEITAARTAAASGLCVRELAPPDWRRVAILGCGEQGRFHARLLRSLNADMELHAYDPHPDRIAALDPHVIAHSDAESAVEGAEIVVTAGPIRSQPRPVVRTEHLAERFLALPLDFDSLVSSDVAVAADVFLVDDEGQFADQQRQGRFADWPAPHGPVGSTERTSRGGRVMCLNLGIGALDAAFAWHVYQSALRDGTGIRLPR